MGDRKTNTIKTPGSPLAISQLTEGAVAGGKLYPNPAHNNIQVVYQSANDNSTILEIDDVSGRQVISQSLQSGNTTVDISMLAPGMYLYKIFDGKHSYNGRKNSQRLIGGF